MEAKRVGMIVVVGLIVLALLGAGLQGMLHQQWIEGFAVGQAAAAQGNGVPAAALAPYAYGAMNQRGPGGILFTLLGIALFFLILRRIVFRRMWRTHYRMNAGRWGQPGNSGDSQPWAQGEMPPWVRSGPWAKWGHHGWSHHEAQSYAHSAAQASAGPAGGKQGPQAPIDL